eukprot:6209248-Pleurochrysis_carterae.AAC.1
MASGAAALAPATPERSGAARCPNGPECLPSSASDAHVAFAIWSYVRIDGLQQSVETGCTPTKDHDHVKITQIPLQPNVWFSACKKREIT